MQSNLIILILFALRLKKTKNIKYIFENELKTLNQINDLIEIFISKSPKYLIGKLPNTESLLV